MRASGEILQCDCVRLGTSESLVSTRVQSRWQLDRDGKLLLRWYLGWSVKRRRHAAGDVDTGTLPNQRA